MKSHNAADKKQVLERDKAAKEAREQELEDIKKILRTLEGKRFFMRLFKHAKITNISYSKEDPNNFTFFNEGWRSCIKPFWCDVCEADPKKAGAMLVDFIIEENKSKGGS